MKSLVDKLLEASNIIAKKSRENADYIIVSPKVAKMIRYLDIKKERKDKLNSILKINK